jgi:hypothetical protein
MYDPTWLLSARLAYRKGAMPHPEFTATLEMLRNRPRELTLDEIAKQCDCSVPWLNKLLAGEIANPSFNRLACLRDYLREKVKHV